MMHDTIFWVLAGLAAVLVGMGKGGVPVVAMLGLGVLALVFWLLSPRLGVPVSAGIGIVVAVLWWLFLDAPVAGGLHALLPLGLPPVDSDQFGGFLLAFAEEIGAGYISSGYRDAMGFLIIIAILLFKPTGLFARAERIG